MSNTKNVVDKTIIIINTKLLPIVAFIVPMLILYICLPRQQYKPMYYFDSGPDSFEKTWQGRTYLLFFLWLFSLETILNWEELRTEGIQRTKSVRTMAYAVSLLLPTLYVTIINFSGLNYMISRLAENSGIGVQWAVLIPLTTEYFVFAVLFAIVILLRYRICRLKNFAISTLFLATIGALYAIDDLYPLGRFTPFQIIVPMTATFAANILNFIGYQTSMTIVTNSYYGNMPILGVSNPGNPLQSTAFGIAWPCSGVESLLIYTVTILLFLSKSGIRWRYKAIYFAIGAAVTYFINILRIVSIFVISMDTGGGFTVPVQRFHDYYGQLYSIVWIISYPLILIGSRVLWGKIRHWKYPRKDSLQPPALVENKTAVFTQSLDKWCLGKGGRK